MAMSDQYEGETGRSTPQIGPLVFIGAIVVPGTFGLVLAHFGYSAVEAFLAAIALGVWMHVTAQFALEVST